MAGVRRSRNMEMEPLLSSQVVSARDQDGSRDLGWKQ